MEINIRCRCPLTSKLSFKIHSNPPCKVETSQKAEYPNRDRYKKFCSATVKQLCTFSSATSISNISQKIKHFEKLREIFVI
jgi:hypothetical protein